MRRIGFLRWLRLGWLAGMLFALIVAAAPVQAHAVLERSDPPNNAILSEPPRQVRMWFSEAVLARFSTVRLLDLNGQEVAGVSLVADTGNPLLLVVDLPILGDGVYSLDWQVLSISDGHTNQGLLVFGVGQTPDEVGAGGAQSAASGAPEPLLATGRIITDLTLFALSGVLMIALALLAGRSGADYQAARRRAGGWALALALLGVLAGLSQLAIQQWGPGAIDAAGGFDWTGLDDTIALTQWGQLWLFRQVVLVAVIVYLSAAREPLARDGSRLAWGMGALLAAAPLATLALSSHAASLDAPDLPMLATWLHYLAASLWVGGLIGLAWVLLPLLRREPGAVEFAHAIWGGFGRYAFAAVGLTLATGLFNTADLVASSHALFSTFYGQTLVRKVVVVLLVGLFGMANSLALHPALSRPLGKLLGRPDGWRLLDTRRLPVTVAVEACLAILVVGLAGTLASSSPANGIGYQFAGITQTDSLSKQVGDLLVTFSVRPNHPGQNQADVIAVSTRRPDPAETLRVILRITYQGKDLGTQSGDAIQVDPARYRLGGSYFSLPGPWKVDVIIRRKGVPDSVAAFDWNVLPLASSPNDFVLRNPFWIAAGVILLAGALVTAWLFIRPAPRD